MDRDYELQTHRAEDRHWWYRGRRTVLERVIEGLQLPERARILDAGCGSGRNMVDFARHGTVTGIELSQTSVLLARERDAGEVIEGSVVDMPFEDRLLRDGRLARRDRAPRGRPRRRCASCAAWSRPAARCWSPSPPTNGCGAATTRSTTTTAATRAAR